ncbi:ribosomal RNA small subunit methyltransferase A [candidate division LCP-89 bacterium B3_LCP]|uniref:Ribosomal RNA small subunit methyltransferase A n=1 Tax=candidate division LCP-89 bacterium B3_LCP TaxID=2012998 RepID=A0A532V1L4_UNCL8|nr:MAG: ribosomal RNA small subunit methyltransferase A [candidate division LCP-89 bacterium B3_LCP]
MHIIGKTAVRNAPRLHGPRPLKELGQHFLQDEEIASQIVESLRLRWEDRVVEIGPGRGVLLRFLLKQSHKVTAVELDARLMKSLTSAFGGHPGLNLIFGDFLEYDLRKYLSEDVSRVKIVGNIPYSLSSSILFYIFEIAGDIQKTGDHNLDSATLMLQREVAYRICAGPGGRDYGGITVFRSLVAEAEVLFDVPPNAFVPPPKVMSSVIRLTFFPQEKYKVADYHLFRDLVHTVFRQRRKMLKNTLKGLTWIRQDWANTSFDFTQRPEDLSAEEFIRLFNLIRN